MNSKGKNYARLLEKVLNKVRKEHLESRGASLKSFLGERIIGIPMNLNPLLGFQYACPSSLTALFLIS